MGLGLAHSRKHNKIIALQQSECGAAQGRAREKAKNEAYVQEVVRFPRGGAGLSLLTVYAFSQDTSPGSQTPAPQAQKETRITPEQTKELFRSLNQILTLPVMTPSCRFGMR